MSFDASYPVQTAASTERARKALFTFWHGRQDVLLRICLRWTRGNRADAEDLLADAYLRVLEVAHPALWDAVRPLALCTTIIANLARDRRRRERVRARVHSQPRGGHSQLPASASGPHEIAYARERLARAMAGTETLSSQQQRAFTLRVAGVEYDQIAHELATSEDNARKLVQLARSSLRSSFVV